MDWFVTANTDWEIYQDILRLKKYVMFGKITEIQYEEITGEPYTV